MIKQFLQTTLFAFVAFIFIFVVIDLMEHMDDFIDHGVPTYIILQYYVVFIPEIIRLMTPVSVLLAGLFVTGKMTNLNELTALKSSGVSIYRYLRPFLITGILISLFSIYFGGYIVPKANKHKLYLEREYMDKNIVAAGRKINFQDSETRIVTIGYFDTYRDIASNISIQEFDRENPTIMLKRIDAVKMHYDSTNSAWVLSSVIERLFYKDSIKILHLNTLTLSDLSFGPDDVLKKQREPQELNLRELKEFAEEQRRTGNNPTRVEIEYHSRIAFSFAAFIVILFGAPLSVNKRKGGLAIQFGISLLITFIYLVFMKIFQAFGKNGVLEPLVTAWAANIVFFIIAIINLFRVRK